MSLESIITEAIEKIAAKRLPMSVTEGVVVTVDKDKRTCDIERDGLPELFEVRLNAVTTPTGVFTIYPKAKSMVLCAMIENNPTDAYVLSCTDIEEIVFNDGENGGMLKVDSVASELQSIKDDLNSIKTAFSNWVVVASDGGAALKLATASWCSQQLADVDTDALQNLKFKH